MFFRVLSVRSLYSGFACHFTVTVGNYTYKGIKTYMVDLDLLQYYYVRKIDKYMQNIVVTIVGDEDISTILSYFS